MRARKRHRRRRGEPRLQRDRRPGGKPLGASCLRGRYPQTRRQARRRAGERQAEVALRRQRLHPLDCPRNISHLRAVEHRRCNHFRPPPHDRAAKRQRQPEPDQGPTRPASRATPARAPPSRARAQSRPVQPSDVPSANHAAIPIPNAATNHSGNCARSASRKSSIRDPIFMKTAGENSRCAGSSDASSMLGALVQSIGPARQEESRLERKQQIDGRGHPLRPLADRLPPYRRRAHGVVQLAVRAPSRRQVPAAHRGYRQGPLDPAGDRRHPRRPVVARDRGRWRTLVPVAVRGAPCRSRAPADRRRSRLSLLPDHRRTHRPPRSRAGSAQARSASTANGASAPTPPKASRSSSGSRRPRTAKRSSRISSRVASPSPMPS